MLEESKIIWNEFTGAVRQPESPFPFHNGNGSLLVSKTTNIGNHKAKAFDLNSTGTFQQKINTNH